ncbi:hypothetical protein [Streptantibioticus cattleyicolor]|uniref:Secreted protein n=1 Tax=Streptantibioticus cattleyicolor (strain ATCC 35852 / DSM 46488 / JCM 4925 / NBRC 14057 / NRRL 8057) TaxID=1003195 RepID=F8JN64_STREN|nr:hypothetical protein [Streptantibioticus cattleyicolor]AEW99186.1 hypothetical protein SCATT_p09930 [Streptantibioticus cattleyicolor NRRL 8057 = DSM 46488]CCB71772.1 exported protein of unknown function [Streptantibioticus cattleyicolor NRRL 8057 = DSM 46488]
MKSSRLGRRVAGTAAVALLVGAGALATAGPAAAKANVITIKKVALHSPGLQVNVTYSCDPGMHHQLVANATAVDQPDTDRSIAAGTIKSAKLVCDYNDHNATVNLRAATGSHFSHGEHVRVDVWYFDEDGFSYAQEQTVALL